MLHWDIRCRLGESIQAKPQATTACQSLAIVVVLLLIHPVSISTLSASFLCCKIVITATLGYGPSFLPLYLEYLHCVGDWVLAQPRQVGESSSLAWHWATGSRWLYLNRVFGQADLQRSLHAVILWNTKSTNLEQNKAPSLPLGAVHCLLFLSQAGHYHLPSSFYSYLKTILNPCLNKASKTFSWSHSLKWNLYFGNASARISNKMFLCFPKENKKLRFW